MPTPTPFSRLPLFLDLSDSRVLLVGGGRTAEAKLGPLAQAGAAIRAVALRHHPSFLRACGRHDRIELISGPFEPAHLDGVRLVVSATDDPPVNARVAALARERGIFCNAVDDPLACDAYFAATLRRGPWQLAIGTQGCFPGLARTLREVLETLVPDGHGETLDELAGLRRRLRSALPGPDARRQRLDRLLRAFRRTYFPTQEPTP